MRVAGLTFEVEDKRGFYVACGLFLLQFVYFQFQDSLIDIIAVHAPQLEDALLRLPFHDLKAAVRFHNIIVHALFSIVIVWFLHKDRRDTLLVVYMSVGLLLFYIAVNAVEKYTGAFVAQLITVRVGAFLASPFKTIFSIPALLLRHPEMTEEKAVVAQEPQVDHP